MKKRILIFLFLTILLLFVLFLVTGKNTSWSRVEAGSPIYYAEVVEIVNPLENIDVLQTPLPTILPTQTHKPTVKPTKTPKPTVKPTKTPKPTKKPKKKKKVKKDIRTFKITAYCPCYRCSGGWGSKTSTGVTPKEGRTIAVDPRVIPYGTRLKINGHTYVAEDCGGAIKGNRIDIFMGSHSSALKWGVRTCDVEILKKKK